MRVRTGLFAGLALAAIAVFAAPPASILFGAHVPLAVPAGEHPIGIALADVTGDGNADVVMAANDFARVLLYAGDGAGGFGAAVPIPLGASNCTRLRTARLDGDAVSDLVADHLGTTTVDVLLADGTGGFTLTTYAAPDGAAGESEYLCLADQDGDGDTDIVTASSAGKVRVRLNDGSGAFAAAQTVAFAAGTTAPVVAYDVVAADLDGDGRVDVALRETTDTGVYWQQSDGRLAAGPRLTPPQSSGFSSHGIAAADFDGDGFADVADMRTVTLAGPPPRGDVNVYRHTAARTFAGAEIYPIATGQWDLLTADLNGDLRPEIVVPTDILPNLGDGTFGAAIPLPAQGWGVATGNFDGDARPDIAVADVFNGGAAIPVRGSAGDPFVATISPSVLHVGASRTVTLGGSGFVAGATTDFGPDVTVHDVAVTSDSTLVVDLTVSPAATPGSAVATVTNPAGGSASVRYEVATGGNADFLSLAPDHANAGEAAVLTLTGSGFSAPLSISLGPDVVVDSIDVQDAGTARIDVTIPLAATPGGPDLTIVNGTGVPTAAAGAFTVLRARSIDLAVTRGRLEASVKALDGSVDVRGTMAFNSYSPDGAFDPMVESASVRVGDPDAPVVVEIPPVAGWKVRGGRMSWKSPKGTLPAVPLTLDFEKWTWRIAVKKADMAPASFDVRAEMEIGDDSGASVETWSSPKGGGGLQYP